MSSHRKSPAIEGGSLRRIVRPLCRPRKVQRCCLCGERIEVGEPCERWSGLDPGEGYRTAHAHPECLELTVLWDDGDWESHISGDIQRPKRPNAERSRGANPDNANQ